MALTDNLVSYYKFDGDATDSVGSNDGTVSGAINGLSYGKINQGYYFDGSNDYISIPLNLNGINTLSLSVWVKFDNKISDNVIFSYGGSELYLWGDDTTSTGNNDRIVFKFGSDERLESSFEYNINTWYHVIIISTSTTNYLYINGNLEDTGSSSNTPSSTSTISIFGADGNHLTSYNLGGNIDEPAIWSRALTSTEVGQLYNSGSGLQYPFTTGWTGKLMGTTNPSKVIDTAVANISKINGV